MTALTTTQPGATHRSAPHSTLRRLVARHPATAFLIMAFAFGWTTLLPLLLSEKGFALLPLEPPVTVFQVAASFLGLVLPAFLVAAATDGNAGVRDLLHRALRWRVRFHWYFIALFGTFGAVLAATIPFFGMLPLQMVARKWELLFTVFLPGVLVPFLHTNLPEEIGWTSLQARLQARHGPLRASFLVAPVFALMHLPAYFVDGWLGSGTTGLAQLPGVLLIVGVTAVFAVFFRLLIMWLYNAMGGSLLIVALFHSAFNMITGPKIMPAFIAGAEASWLNVFVVVTVALIAVLVALFTKGRLAYKPDRASRQ